jgi:hypothetical protein
MLEVSKNSNSALNLFALQAERIRREGYGMRHRKDDNQRDVEQALARAGALWIDCTGDPCIGFDGLIAFRGKLFVVEVKDGAKVPSARRLTKGESTRKFELEMKGVEYNVVESVDEALKLIGAIR